MGGGERESEQGGLTSAGLGLLEKMAELGFIWDVSHLTEEGVWQGLDLRPPRVCASHATARTLIPTNRHLSDEVIRAIAERDGVIGLVLYNGFLEPRWNFDRSIPVTIGKHLQRHTSYLADVGGWNHVGIGSDLDGGFGLEESPLEIDTVADLYRTKEAVSAEHREAVLSANWLRFRRSSLPGTS